MKRRILSILLCLILVVGMLPTMAFAEGTSTVYVSASGEDSNDGTQGSPVKTLSKAYEKISANGGTIYLLSNVTLDKTVNLNQNKTVTITSVGETAHTITRCQNNPDFSMFNVSYGTLTLQNVTLDGNKTKSSPRDEVGQAISISGGATVNLNDDMTITHFYGTNYSTVFVCKGTLNMYEGASITKNRSDSYGGGLRINDNDAVVNIYGGEITNNFAKIGGGIYLLEGKLNLLGGKISENGNLDTSVANESGSGAGINVSTKSSCKLTVGGTAVVKENYANASWNEGSFTVTHDDDKSVLANVYLPAANSSITMTISSEKPLAEGARIGVTTGDTPGKILDVLFAKGGNNGDEKYFSYDRGENEAAVVYCSGNGETDYVNGEIVTTTVHSAIHQQGLWLSLAAVQPEEVYVSNTGNDGDDVDDEDDKGDGSRDKPYATIDMAYSKVKSGGTIYLLSDITPTSGITLNNSKIVKITSDSTEMSKSNDNRPFSIISSAASGGTVTDMFLVNGGTLTLENIKLNGNGSNNARGIEISSGATVNLENGATITGFTNNDKGGGVCVGSGAILNMNGGTITGNAATKGGGVYVGLEATLNVKGGKVSENHTSAVKSVSSNVYLESGQTIAIAKDGIKDGDTIIGVTTSTAPRENNDVKFATGASADDAKYFQYDKGMNAAGVVHKDGELYFSAVKSVTVTGMTGVNVTKGTQTVTMNTAIENITLSAATGYAPLTNEQAGAISTKLDKTGLKVERNTNGTITISGSPSQNVNLDLNSVLTGDYAPKLGQAKIDPTIYSTLGEALTAAASNNTADTIEITGATVTPVSGATLESDDTLKDKSGNTYTAKDNDAKIDVTTTGAVTLNSGKLEVTAANSTSATGTTVKVKTGDNTTTSVTIPKGTTVTLDAGNKTAMVAANNSVTIDGITFTAGNEATSFPLEVTNSRLSKEGDKANVPKDKGATINLSASGEAAKVSILTNRNGAVTVEKATGNGGTVTIEKENDTFKVGEKTYKANSDNAVFIIGENGDVTISSGSAKIGDGASIISGVSGKTITNPTNSENDEITVTPDATGNKDTVTVPGNGKVSVGSGDGVVEYENASATEPMTIEVTKDNGNKLTDGAVKLDKGETINVGNNTEITNTGEQDSTITVKANYPDGKSTVIVNINDKVTIGGNEYKAQQDTTFIVENFGDIELQNGNTTFSPGSKLKVNGVEVRNTDSNAKTIDVALDNGNKGQVWVSKEAKAEIGAAKITVLSTNLRFEVNPNGSIATVVLNKDAGVEIGSETYTSGANDSTLTIDLKTGKVIGIAGSINTTIDGSKLNEDFSYELLPGQSVTIGKYVYTAPSGDGTVVGDVTIKGRGNDESGKVLNPAVVLKKATGTVDVSLKDNEEAKTTYTSANAGTKFAMSADDNDTTKVDLLDNAAPSANSALKFTDKDSHTVNGVIYQAQSVKDTATGEDKDVAYTVTYGTEGTTAVNANTISVGVGSKVAATMEANATIKIGNGRVGDKVFSSATPFTATSSGASIIIDNTKGEAQPEISGNGRSYLTPVYDKATGEVGTDNIIGYQITQKRSSGGSSTVINSSVNVGSTKDGKVIVSSKSAASGETVTVTVNPDEGYQLKSLVVKDKDGNAVNLTKKSENVYTFAMPAGGATVEGEFVVIEAETKVNYKDCTKGDDCVVCKLKDSQSTAWYHDGIHYCLDNGLMVGTSDTTFSPDDNITRGQIVTILWRLEGSKSVSGDEFKDVKTDEYYASAVAWACENNIVNGYGNEMFGPDDSITREQLAAILYRYAEYKKMDTANGEVEIDKFSDSKNVSNYALDAIKWAVGSQIMNGTTTTQLSPTGTATRAQSACLMQRFITGNK